MQVFDTSQAEEVISTIIKYAPNLEILNLSFNQLPENSLSFFINLLKNPQFKYLDVQGNPGAGSMDALRLLTTKLGEEGIKIGEQAELLKKVIWIPEAQLGKIASLPKEYLDAHSVYYNNKKEFSVDKEWTIPTSEGLEGSK
jgi:hypothetical protein